MDPFENTNAASQTLRRVQDILRYQGTRLNLHATARSLGMADRTLQYNLAKAGTSFREQIQAARIESAKRLLATTRLKVAAVAFDVGFSSSPHFSTWFKEHVGCSPSEWRRAQRLTGSQPALAKIA